MLDSDLDGLDIACGMVAGVDTSIEPLSDPPPGVTVHDALELATLRALERTPCLVSFSGGKDSSVLLALASRTAAKYGLPPPVPATVYGSHVDTDETDWQDSVLAHLGIVDRWTMRVTDDFEALGSLSTRFLLAHGLRYPWNTHFHQPIVDAAKGGSLLTGAGGDELFDPYQWARYSELRGQPNLLRPRDAMHLAGVALPRWLRGYLLARRDVPEVPWLTKHGNRLMRRRFAAWLAADPLSPAEHLCRWWWPSRYLQHGMASLQLLAADGDVLAVSPFAEAPVIAAFAKDRLRYPLTSRLALMEALFHDLLPPGTLRRSSKAVFGSWNLGPRTRAFIDRWEPCQIDTHMVDVDALRVAWQDLGDQRCLGLLKQEWLATRHSSEAVVA